jgi:ferredoxin-thioredoxin reductase catalytic subunit
MLTSRATNPARRRTAALLAGSRTHREPAAAAAPRGEATLGAPLCPCRHYDDKAAEIKKAYWNCPCVPMQKEKKCHCMLFLTPDNEFAGELQDVTVDEVRPRGGGRRVTTPVSCPRRPRAPALLRA